MRILNVCAEFAPLAKAGGLADVTSGLSTYLISRGHDVLTLLPRYAFLPLGTPLGVSRAMTQTSGPSGDDDRYEFRRLNVDETTDIILLECPKLFGGQIYEGGENQARRFIVLCESALELCELLDWWPDVIHCHDWHTALIPLLLRARTRTNPQLSAAWTVLTIHNIGYQGVFPLATTDRLHVNDIARWLDPADVAASRVNFLKLGIEFADALTTVSPTHAHEICTPELGMGIDKLLHRKSHRLQGILNGVDYARWNPETDRAIARNYSIDTIEDRRDNKVALLDELRLDVGTDTPLIGMVSRLVQQKGSDLVVDVLPEFLREESIALVVLGTGEPEYVAGMRILADGYAERMFFHEAHDEDFAHRMFASCDLLLVPSRYEPCGLTQMYALRYGAVPIVRRTGGLADTIEHFNPATCEGNGCVFVDADAGGLRWGIATAVDWYANRSAWHKLVANGMRQDFSWAHAGREYEQLYTGLTGKTL